MAFYQLLMINVVLFTCKDDRRISAFLLYIVWVRVPDEVFFFFWTEVLLRSPQAGFDLFIYS